MSRTKITSLLGYSIRDIRLTNHGAVALKLHSKEARRTIWISASPDSLADEKGELYEIDVPFTPEREIWP
jgi:hypothetical protein